jgi:hypothetical protein
MHGQNLLAVAEHSDWFNEVRVHGQNYFDVTVLHDLHKQRHRELLWEPYDMFANGEIYGGKTPFSKGAVVVQIMPPRR